jgi:hypothetical protein
MQQVEDVGLLLYIGMCCWIVWVGYKIGDVFGVWVWLEPWLSAAGRAIIGR